MRESSLFRILFVAASCATLWLSLMAHPPQPPMDIGDKAQHFAAFAVLFWLSDFAWRPAYALPGKALGLLAFGALIEWLQSFTSVRMTEWGDILADGAGITAYWIAHPWALRMAFWRRWLPATDA